MLIRPWASDFLLEFLKSALEPTPVYHMLENEGWQIGKCTNQLCWKAGIHIRMEPLPVYHMLKKFKPVVLGGKYTSPSLSYARKSGIANKKTVLL